MSSSRVAHFCVGDQVFERIEALDGKQRQVYRHNDLVHTVWPQAGLAVVERRSLQSNLPSTTQSVDPRALDQYELRPEGRDRVAGPRRLGVPAAAARRAGALRSASGPTTKPV
jgi:sigma-E factor negative regulatory protein RseB